MLLKLRADVPLLTDWLQRKNDKYASHDIQNELVSIMADNVLRQVVISLDNSFFQSFVMNTQMSIIRNN